MHVTCMVHIMCLKISCMFHAWIHVTRMLYAKMMPISLKHACFTPVLFLYA